MSIYKPGRPNKYNPSTDSGQKPPAKPGEYRMRDEKGRITYVGETNDLSRRTKEHIRTGKLATSNTIEYKVADGRSSSRTRREHEQKSIAKHKPTLNKSKGGEGNRQESNLLPVFFAIKL